MMNVINMRIKELRQELGLSQKNFGASLGLSDSGISNIESGIRNVTEKHIRLLVSEFKVNEQWLRTGDGDMFKISDNTAFDHFADEYRLDSVTRSAMLAFVKLPEDYRHVVLAAIRSVAAACLDSADDEAIAYAHANDIIDQKLKENGM